MQKLQISPVTPEKMPPGAGMLGALISASNQVHNFDNLHKYFPLGKARGIVVTLPELMFTQALRIFFGGCLAGFTF